MREHRLLGGESVSLTSLPLALLIIRPFAAPAFVFLVMEAMLVLSVKPNQKTMRRKGAWLI
jgi:hypothetical protein